MPGDIAAALLGDIGGTNARFALMDGEGRIDHIRILAVARYPGIAEAIEAYLADIGRAVAQGSPARPKDAALDIAGPVAGDEVALTNHPWSFSRMGLRERLGVERLMVVNDFAAVAAAAPHLPTDDLARVGPAVKAPSGGAPIGVIGAGSGLGVGAVLPVGGLWTALPGEGGHVSLPASSERESAVLDAMRRRFGHVSAERALSGPGLVNLYLTLAALDGAAPVDLKPAEVTARASSDRHCAEAVSMFAEMLGTVAGDLALTIGARGGVQIAGGIVPRLGAAFPGAAFRRRFEEKGRLGPYVAAIPTFVIRHPFPAFVGLAALLRGLSIIGG